ncbi:decapping endonuclease targeting mRNA [Elasticomyces elasticus]|nr:decapping endonuclease targeting mRNA [Elasticomyces elasticus]KAK4990140.1 decapping endonuclease targeting mRNA [Elasticomyces elasticus]
MAPFDIKPLERFVAPGKNATIKKPHEIAHFSFDAEHQLLPFSTDSLRYYYPPFFPAANGEVTKDSINLSHGFDSFQQLDDGPDEHLDALLDTIMEMEKRDGKRCHSDVVTWRGMMTKVRFPQPDRGKRPRSQTDLILPKIVTAPFDTLDGFEMNATLFQHAQLFTRYIEENHDYKLEDKQRQFAQKTKPGMPSQQLMSYWGYKFESLSLLPVPWAEASRDLVENREADIVNNHAQYCSVVRTRIGSTSVVLGGEVDAVLGAKPDDSETPPRWVELKTTLQPIDNKPRANYERKLLKFWAQSFLLGVPKIVVGFRTPNGLLVNLTELETKNIPMKVRQGLQTWDGNTCINFSAAFLDFLKQHIVGEGVWRIQRSAKSDVIEVFKIRERGTGEILKAEFKKWKEELLVKEELLAKEVAEMLGRPKT